MVNESRLTAALAAGRAPAHDPAFVLSVMRAAEVARYRVESAKAMLRAGGLGAAAAALAVPVLGWVAAEPEAVQSGMLAAAGLLALAWTARFMTQGAIARAWGR